ncbi:hypothetical protein B5807_01653 [Epicoccum nigrum]|uniref:Uncharacterized protein n=1 Tax=Epicoccum nigrum TaxID=105696 RepID=A0A1Y2MEQ2_EPING|nr:hypothetical protein B5807_01653 [Epicoccum nigrum]
MASSSIPLLCSICPKKPKFSDVSHLLTHIASKGHLSNYYKVKVRSTHEEDSRLVIEAYDQWYADWNVEELMSDRMNQKDKRRTRARPAARPTPSAGLETPLPRSARRRAVGGLLDPRLSEQLAIKVETDSVNSTPTPRRGPVLRHRAFASHLQYWPTDSRASSRSYTNPDYETSSEYSDPGERARRYQYAADETCAIEDDPAGTANGIATASESIKLKGVYWPGMDIFDSATPEMRRKRNQKKDHSVVEQLELNSQDVEATELIFTPHGSFKRQRRISSSVFDDEEEEEEVEAKNESSHPALSRPVLASMDPNVPSRSRLGARALMFPFQAQQYDDRRGRSGLELDIGERAPKRQRAFDVFQDEEASFTQPANFTYLTAGFNGQASPSPLPTFAPYRSFNDPFQYDNKENIFSTLHQPSFNLHGHQMPGLHYPNYTYSLANDQQVLQPGAQTFGANSLYQQQFDTGDDDQRTITAPPSPASS